MTQRLFAALDVPEDVRAGLDVLVEPRRDADPNLHWTPRRNWHVTLAFFGDVPDTLSEPLEAALADVRGDPFPVVLDGAGCFPNPSRGRVLYQAVAEGADALAALSRRVRVAADRVGVPSDSAGFVPHLTLARTRRPAELTRWLRIVDAFAPARFEATGFTLFASELHRSGADHRIVRQYDWSRRPQSEWRPSVPSPSVG